jgi:hypothetical protein
MEVNLYGCKCGKVHKVEWSIICPTCGSDRSGLLNCSHDFINDCPKCRRGIEGCSGSTGRASKNWERRAFWE